MANKEHLAILNQGAEVWNSWNKKNLDVKPDLMGADLAKANLEGVNLGRGNLSRVNLSGANLKMCKLVDANLSEARLDRANLNDAYLENANLRGATLRESELKRANLRNVDLRKAHLDNANLVGAYLDEADLKGANLQKADLQKADLSRADLTETFLSNANLEGTIFGHTYIINVDLSKTKGLQKIRHDFPSYIGGNTIRYSMGKIPEIFLRGCGLSEHELVLAKLWRKGMDRREVTLIAYEFVNTYCDEGIQFYSAFISYHNANQAFARKLHDDLQNNGVRCWFAPEDMKIGDRIRPTIDQEIRLRDKLLVILSENSINSEWVGDEVEAALEEEQASGRTILFPIRLDGAVMNTRQDWAAKIKCRRHIGDFTGWKNEIEYQKAFDRLLRDLKSIGDK